jgi:hypothetical protein
MLDLIVAKAMAKLLEDRHQTGGEPADDLREVPADGCRGHGAHASNALDAEEAGVDRACPLTFLLPARARSAPRKTSGLCPQQDFAPSTRRCGWRR